MAKIKHLRGTIIKTIQEQDQAKKIVGAIASSSTKDRDGEILQAAGWSLDNFKKAPRLLWSHDVMSLPIGKITDIHIDDDNLIFDAEFAEKEYPFAAQVAKMVPEYINTFSVGFIPLESDEKGNINKQELLEISLVNVPANPDAVISSAMKNFNEECQKIYKRLDKKEIETKSPECRMDGEAFDDCVSRKIPEIKKDNPEMEQDQVIAIAASMCRKSCEEKSTTEEEKKEMDDDMMKNMDDMMKISRDHIKEGISALEDAMQQMHNLMGKKSLDMKSTRLNLKKINSTSERALRKVDRIVELALRDLKRRPNY